MTDYVVHLSDSSYDDLVINEKSQKPQIYCIVICDENDNATDTAFYFKNQKDASDFIQDNDLEFCDLEFVYDYAFTAHTEDPEAIEQGLQFAMVLSPLIVWYCK